MDNKKDFLSGLIKKDAVKQAFGITDRTLLAWAKSGLLPRVKIGKFVYYRVTDLAKLTEGGEA